MCPCTELRQRRLAGVQFSVFRSERASDLATVSALFNAASSLSSGCAVTYNPSAKHPGVDDGRRCASGLFDYARRRQSAEQPMRSERKRVECDNLRSTVDLESVPDLYRQFPRGPEHLSVCTKRRRCEHRLATTRHLDRSCRRAYDNGSLSIAQFRWGRLANLPVDLLRFGRGR